MLIKCKDHRIVQFDENLVFFSKTLVVLKKYSIENSVFLQNVNSKTISIIQEWLSHRFYMFSDLEKTYLFQNHKYDKNFFCFIISKYENIKKPIIIELLKAADFLNISALLNSLILFISVRLINFTSVKINNYLNLKNIPKVIKEKIFFLISKRRFLLNKKFGSQRLMIDEYSERKNKFLHLNGYGKSLNEFYLSKLDKLSNDNKISYNTFTTFDSLNGHFLFYENNESVLENFIFPKVSLNLKFDKSFFYKYFGDEIRNSFLSGGIFSSYDTKNIFSIKYSKLKEIFTAYQNYDLYFIDYNDIKFEKYLAKFRDYPNTIITRNDDKNQFNTIKVNINSYLFNLIFIKKIKCKNVFLIEINDFAKVLSKFDFLLNKIFYAFKVNKTMLNIGLFKNFEYSDQFPSQKGMLLNNIFLEEYVQELKSIRLRLFILGSWFELVFANIKLENFFSQNNSFYEKFKLIEKTIKFSPSDLFFQNQNKNFLHGKYKSFYTTDIFIFFYKNEFIRFLKYLIKGYYNDENLIFKHFDPLYKIFGKFFEKLCEDFQLSLNSEDNLNELFYECMFNFCINKIYSNDTFYSFI